MERLYYWEYACIFGRVIANSKEDAIKMVKKQFNNSDKINDKEIKIKEVEK